MYFIRHKSSGKLIALVGGEIILAYPANCKGYGSWVWKCSYSSGYLRFHNYISGGPLQLECDSDSTFPTNDDQRSFPWVDFCPIYCRKVGYVLGIPKWTWTPPEELLLLYVGLKDDGETLIETGKRNEAAVWRFGEV